MESQRGSRGSKRLRLGLAGGVAWMSMLLTACEGTHRPLGVSAAPNQPGSVGLLYQNPHARYFARLARQLPGFGGYYYDADGNLVVYLKDLTRQKEAIQLLTPTLRGQRLGDGGREVREQHSGSIIIRQGQYDFVQLSAWQGTFTAGMRGTPGIIQVGVDEGRNRLFVGVDRGREAQGRSEAARILSAQGIPPAAVIVEAIQPFKLRYSIDRIPETVRALDSRPDVFLPISSPTPAMMQAADPPRVGGL